MNELSTFNPRYLKNLTDRLSETPLYPYSVISDDLPEVLKENNPNIFEAKCRIRAGFDYEAARLLGTIESDILLENGLIPLVGIQHTANYPILSYIRIENNGEKPISFDSYLGNKSLFDLEVDEIRDLLFQIFRPVRFLHDQSLVHGDLNPDNYFLTIPYSPYRDSSPFPNWHPLAISESKRANYRIQDRVISFLGDFETLSMANSMRPFISHFEYVAPEARGIWVTITKKMDVYSLGMTLLRLFYSKPGDRDLFRGIATRDRGSSNTKQKGVRELLLERIPADDVLKPILAKAVSIDPEERFEDAKDFYTELDILLHEINLRANGVGTGDLRKLVELRREGLRIKSQPNPPQQQEKKKHKLLDRAKAIMP